MMEKLDLSNFILKKSIYHNLIYTLITALVIILRVAKLYTNTTFTVIYASVLFLVMILDIVIKKIDSEKARKVLIVSKWAQLVMFTVFEYFVVEELFLLIVTGLLVAACSVEVILHNMDYDTYDTNMKKVLCIFPSLVLLGFLYGKMQGMHWICYFVYKVIVFLAVFYFIEFYLDQEKKYRAKNNKLQVENSNYESINTKLMEYQEKIEAVNKQINYQKIDLNRAYKNLEETNVEIESQTELMKYMASTFDVTKCINVITDTIIDVKKPKICAVYIDKEVYMNKVPTCVVKSDYTSMAGRLKNEADAIFADFSTDKFYPDLFVGEQVHQFKFIGDTNICAIAVLPLIKDDKKYGYMLIGSDKENFFNKGFVYYENCIMQFNISIKSTLLYLQMRSMARRDGLTGIYNRLYFKELFEKAKTSAMKYSYKLSVALFDIDKFKLINDTYGHLAGDNVIKMVASIDEKYADKYSGFACRYGGEEFLLVLPGKDKDQALDILEKMHDEIKNTVVDFEGTRINANVSVGLSVYPDICEDADKLISRADKSMYYGKLNGRGRIIVDNPDIDAFLE